METQWIVLRVGRDVYVVCRHSGSSRPKPLLKLLFAVYGLRCRCE